jgi:hypothetical protein
VFQQIQERLDSDLDKVVDDEERDRQEKKHYLFKLCQQLERHLKELPVVGFNYFIVVMLLSSHTFWHSWFTSAEMLPFFKVL